MKHLKEGGTNVYMKNPGHMTMMDMTMMAVMAICGKNSSPKTVNHFKETCTIVKY